MVERNIVDDEQACAFMKEAYGRVAAPAVVVGGRLFWGFHANRAEIAELLGVEDDGTAG